MEIIVTGAAGFVGRQLCQHLSGRGHEVIGTYHTNRPAVESVAERQLDITNNQQVKAVLSSVNPDIVIHAAAIVDADKCETAPKRAWETNLKGTENVVRACERVRTKVILLSSSFVFSGSAPQYVESSSRKPVNVYGETKVAAEDTVCNADIGSLIVRIDQPYDWSADWQSDSMVEWVLRRLDEEGSVEVFSDWYNNPIHNADVANFVGVLLEGECHGTYHVVGPEYISRYHWARRIAAVFGYDIDRVKPTSSSKADLPAKRPNTNLSLTRLISETGQAPRETYYHMLQMAETTSQ